MEDYFVILHIRNTYFLVKSNSGILVKEIFLVKIYFKKSKVDNVNKVTQTHPCRISPVTQTHPCRISPVTTDK